MKFVTTGAITLATALSLFAFSAPAEARWAPNGSYESSCQHIDFDGDMLTATCQRRDGSWRNTWLDNADECDGRIVNNNGQLECAQSDWRDRYARHRGFDVGPAGSYRGTCDDIRMDGYTLRATCERRDGAWRWTSLDNAYDCDGRIANFDGRLVCTRGRY
ncbi:MAG TPA: CVNH domain-containing protein [Rhizomicrobium sp.]|nr:CVNH domain-containing protein [Rhizomicrobium sp.]